MNLAFRSASYASANHDETSRSRRRRTSWQLPAFQELNHYVSSTVEWCHIALEQCPVPKFLGIRWVNNENSSQDTQKALSFLIVEKGFENLLEVFVIFSFGASGIRMWYDQVESATCPIRFQQCNRDRSWRKLEGFPTTRVAQSQLPSLRSPFDVENGIRLGLLEHYRCLFFLSPPGESESSRFQQHLHVDKMPSPLSKPHFIAFLGHCSLWLAEKRNTHCQRFFDQRLTISGTN